MNWWKRLKLRIADAVLASAEIRVYTGRTKYTCTAIMGAKPKLPFAVRTWLWPLQIAIQFKLIKSVNDVLNGEPTLDHFVSDEYEDEPVHLLFGPGYYTGMRNMRVDWIRKSRQRIKEHGVICMTPVSDVIAPLYTKALAT